MAPKNRRNRRNTNFACDVCEYREIIYHYCGHALLEPVSEASGSTHPVCQHFHEDGLGIGYCTRNLNPTPQTVRMSDMPPRDVNGFCCRLDCSYAAIAQARQQFDNDMETYRNIGIDLFSEPGLRHVVKRTPDDAKQCLKQVLFSAERLDVNQELGPNFKLAMDRMDMSIERAHDRVSDLQRHIEQRKADNSYQYPLIHHAWLTPREDRPLVQEKLAAAEFLRNTMGSTRRMQDMVRQLRGAVHKFYQTQDAMVEAGVELFERFEESARRWEVAKIWGNAVFEELFEDDETTEERVQRNFWHHARENQPVGADAFYMQARHPWERETPAPARRSNLSYWDEIGAFDSIANLPDVDDNAESSTARNNRAFETNSRHSGR